MMNSNYPILEFDPAQEAVIEPKRVHAAKDVPAHAVVCFFQDVIARLQQEEGATLLHTLRSEIGPHPVYEMAFQGQRLAVFHPGLGAPLAAGLLEEVIALGCTKFIVLKPRGLPLRSQVHGYPAKRYAHSTFQEMETPLPASVSRAVYAILGHEVTHYVPAQTRLAQCL